MGVGGDLGRIAPDREDGLAAGRAVATERRTRAVDQCRVELLTHGKVGDVEILVVEVEQLAPLLARVLENLRGHVGIERDRTLVKFQRPRAILIIEEQLVTERAGAAVPRPKHHPVDRAALA